MQEELNCNIHSVIIRKYMNMERFTFGDSLLTLKQRLQTHLFRRYYPGLTC